MDDVDCFLCICRVDCLNYDIIISIINVFINYVLYYDIYIKRKKEIKISDFSVVFLVYRRYKVYMCDYLPFSFSCKSKIRGDGYKREFYETLDKRI